MVLCFPIDPLSLECHKKCHVQCSQSMGTPQIARFVHTCFRVTSNTHIYNPINRTGIITLWQAKHGLKSLTRPQKSYRPLKFLNPLHLVMQDDFFLKLYINGYNLYRNSYH